MWALAHPMAENREVLQEDRNYLLVGEMLTDATKVIHQLRISIIKWLIAVGKNWGFFDLR